MSARTHPPAPPTETHDRGLERRASTHPLARRPARPHSQFAVFALVGIGNTIVDAGVFTLLAVTLGWHHGAAAVLASTIGFLAGAVNSYVWNSRVTFSLTHDSDSLSAVGSFLAVIIVGAGISALVFAAAITVWPSEATRLVAAKLIAIAATTVWNFALMRHWVFSPRPVLPWRAS